MLLSILQAGILVGLGISFFAACYRLVAPKDAPGKEPASPRDAEHLAEG